MADSDTQASTMHYADDVLRFYFEAANRQAYVATDTMIYYREGDDSVYVAPDVMVVLGLPYRPRKSYRLWEQGNKSPDLVIEVQSTSTHLKDEKDKRDVYLWMGVREYFRYDPEGDAMAPKKQGRRLIGERLKGGKWQAMPVQADGSIRSAVLGLDLRLKRKERFPDWRELRFRDPATGKDLPSYRASRAGEQRAQEAKERERAAKERAQLRAKEAERNLEREVRARRQAERRTEDAERRSRKADRRIAELEALLREVQGRNEGE